MIFETERLYVKRWEAEDLLALYHLFNDEAIKEFLLPKLTIEDYTHIFEEQINSYHDQLPFGRYFIVEKSTDQIIGLLLVKKNENQSGVEIGYSLKKEHWNKGYATEIVEESVNWLFAQKRFSHIYAVIETDNIGSQNVLLKCNFIRQENFIEDGKEMSLFILKN